MLFFHEVFKSIQGEGTDSGIPCTFVRLYGCNLKCGYCDQPQKPTDRKRISVTNLVSEIRRLQVNNVCITGGEPLMQPEVYSVIYELVKLGFNVSIETNGAIAIDDDIRVRTFKYVMDVKCPSSGVSYNNIYENLGNLHCNDEVKFVVADLKDYEFAKGIMKKYPTKAKVLFSPVFDYENKQSVGSQLVEWILKDKLNVRVSLQIHKFLEVQ